MSEIHFEAGDAFRVTLRPISGGRVKKVIMQGDVPMVGTQVTMNGEKYRITKIQAERIIAVIETPPRSRIVGHAS